MATRYSGEVVIAIRMKETRHGATYHCALRGPDAEKAIVEVGSPKMLEHAIDSPDAFDAAARAAISFAQDEDGGFENVASKLDGSGHHVGRTMEDAWPEE